MQPKVIANSPAPKNLTLTVKDLRPYFKTVEKVIDHILHTARAMDGLRLYPVKFKKTIPWNNELVFNGGMALDLQYGKPARIFTPLGEVKFITGSKGNAGPLMGRLTRTLGLELFIPHDHDFLRINGPTYHITRTPDGERLPKAILEENLILPDQRKREKLWKAIIK